MLCPECNQDNPPVYKFCGSCGVSAPTVLATGVGVLNAGAAARRPEPDKRVLGGLVPAMMAGRGNSATIANALLAIQHAVQFQL
jgi:hypothetical protein